MITIRTLAVTLALGAVAPLASAAQPTLSPEAQHGHDLFMQKNCYFCHGTLGNGSSQTGLPLAPRPLSADAIRAYVRHPTGQMPPYAPEILTDADIEAIHAYLASLPAGRPASEIPLLGGSVKAR